jgi:hypothetical protein
MALIVETGTGSASSDSFVSVVDCDNYHSDLGNAAWTGTQADKEAALRRATAYVSTGFTFTGKRTNGRSQALAWPRTGVTDREGVEIADDEVPYEVVDATCEAALFEIATPNGLLPTVVMMDNIKTDKVGDVSTTYQDAPKSADEARPILSKLETLMADLLASPNGSGATTFLARA